MSMLTNKMTKPSDYRLSTSLEGLRARVEKLVSPSVDRNFSEMSNDDIASLVHELETHQIELEIQNQNLCTTQDVLVEVSDEYAQLYETAPVGYITTNSRGYIQKANLTLCEMLGYPRTSIDDKRITAFIEPEDQDIYYQHRKQALDTEQKVSCALRFRTSTGEPFWIRMDSMSEINPHNGEPYKIRSVLIDINELKMTEQALKMARQEADSANLEKTRFLASMSHEVRTPMNGVRGMASLLVDTSLDPQQRQYVEVIQQSSEALISIVNDLLDISRIEAKQVQLDLSEFNIAKLVQSIINMFEPQLDAETQQIECTLSPELRSSYVGDNGRIRQILINLIGNAIKFTQQGQVSINISSQNKLADHELIRFEIQDTGTGIASENLSGLFERYAQTDISYSSSYGGTGLGLAICKGLVDAMQGHIGVETKLGEGSLFWFELPLSFDTVLKIDEPALQEQGVANDRSLNVLVVDDETVSQLVARSLVEALGHQVDVVSNGQEAVDTVKNGHYDLIFMDIQMPEMDGLQATRLIRQFNSKIPVIGFTANAMKENRAECIAAGMNDFTAKPVNKQIIKDILIHAFSHQPNPDSLDI